MFMCKTKILHLRPCQKYTMVLRYRRPLQISAARSFLLPTNKKIAAAPKKIEEKKLKKN